jgi:tryptophan synthase alpha chain
VSRIAARFAALAQHAGGQGRGALIPFLAAFDPDRETMRQILHGLPAAGADLIEIGVPFTDPVADGPTVQKASLRGLAAGATLPGTLALVAGFRQTDQTTPIILMGYLNPIEQYGPSRFCKDAAAAGVDGLIIVDLPSEESDLIAADAAANHLDIIRLIAPTTDDARLPLVLAGSSGFVYYVSITGITGTARATDADLAAALPRLRRATTLPIAIGFGIRTPQHAAAAVTIADAAVVGSALIERMVATLDPDGHATDATVAAVLTEVSALAAGVRGAAKAN